VANNNTIPDFIRQFGNSTTNMVSQLSPTFGQTDSYINSLKPRSIRNVSEIWGEGNAGTTPIVQPPPPPPPNPYVNYGYVTANYVENTY
jgi:hypothetical protein